MRAQQRRFRSFLLLTAAVLLLAGRVGAVIVARHGWISVSSGSTTVVQLDPIDLEGDPMTATITGLPTSGTLWHLSTNYINFGYTPVKGTQITAAGTVLTAGATFRVVYVAPVAETAERFTYTVTDGIETSLTGIIEVTPSTGVTISSDFGTDEDLWQVVTAQTVLATWSGTSTGQLNRFIYGQFGSLVLGANNDVRWYFSAPAKFSRNNGRLYGGRLEFWLGHFEGDLSGDQRATPFTSVQLECSTCASGAGIVLAQRGLTYTGGITQVSLHLTELPSDGWLKDPFDDTVTAWSSPTQCEVFQVLSGLSGIRIYGDFANGAEVVGLDAVQLRVVSPLATIPTACY